MKKKKRIKKRKIINLESELEEMSKHERRIEEENKEVKGDKYYF